MVNRMQAFWHGLLAMSLFFLLSAQASALVLEGFDLPSEQQAEAIPEKLDPPISPTNWSTGTYKRPGAQHAEAYSSELQPFGAHLFHGASTGTLNPWWMPGGLDMMWLVLNGTVCVLLGLGLAGAEKLDSGGKR